MYYDTKHTTNLRDWTYRNVHIIQSSIWSLDKRVSYPSSQLMNANKDWQYDTALSNQSGLQEWVSESDRYE